MENLVCQKLREQYGIGADQIVPMTVGVGGETYRVDSKEGRFVIKIADANEMNHPEREPELCNFLLKRHVPVSEFIPTKTGELYTSYDSNRICHVQRFIEGDTYPMNHAPSWLMEQMPVVLGKIHMNLRNYSDLPCGIGEDFFRYMTPQRALESYHHSLETAIKQKDTAIIDDLEFRIKMAEQMSPADFDLNRLTICNTHGDYTINQIICSGERLASVIDWTSACKHPVVWELTRSFFYGNPGCIDGAPDDSRFGEYIKGYCEISPLNPYDLRYIKAVYFYQIAVCDYYSQYLNAEDSKKEEYLTQAQFATKVLRNANL